MTSNVAMVRARPLLALLLLAALTGANPNDDFGFELGDSEDLVVELTEPPPAPVKLKGVPDVDATIGKLLDFRVPDDAFKGNVVKLEVSSDIHCQNNPH